MSAGHKIIAGIGAYLVVAFLTYGHAYHIEQSCELLPQEVKWQCRYETAPAFGAGYFWPLYWGGKLAIEVTRPQATAKQER